MTASAPSLVAQTPSASDGFDPNVNGVINAMALQPNGQIVIGGNFTTVQPNEALSPTARNRIARINADGSVDTSFNPNANNQIYAIAVQSDGKILIGGNFTTLQPNGASAPITRNHIARLNSDGTLDASFNPNAQGTLVAQVFAIALQPDGKILIGGAFSTLQPPNAASPVNQPNLARLNTDGTVDTGFAPDPLATITAIGVEPNGQIVVGGAFTGIALNGTLLGRNHVARFNANGTFDSGFDPNCNGTIDCIAFQQDGKILLGGNFTTLQPAGAATAVTRNNLARLNSDGTLDTNFAPNPSSTVNCMALQRDGKIVIGGSFFQILPQGTASGAQVNHIARLNTDGSVDLLFDPSTNGTVQALVVQNDGKIVMGGNFSQVFANAAVATSTRNNMARVNPDGTLDATFNPDGSGRILVMARQPDGKILLGGNFTSFGGVTTANIARMSAAGVLDASFAPLINGPVSSFAVQANGQIVIGGSFTNINGVSRSNIARLNADGSLDLSYNPNPNGPVTGLALQSDGKLLLAGAFSALQPNSSSTATLVSNFARLNTDGTVDPNINLNVDSRVNAVVVQSDGKFIVGGEFTHVVPNNLGPAPNNGTVLYTRNFIARFSADGSLDTAWDPNVNNSVNTLALDGQGRCLVGGAFTQLAPNESTTVLNLARLIRLNTDGSADQGFNPNPNQTVTGIGVQPDGHILAVGNFGTLTPNAGVGIFSRNFLARVNSDGSLDQNFNPQPNGNVNSVLVLPDGSFYVGGGFTAIANTLTTHLALFNASAAINTAFLPQAAGVAGNSVNSIAVQPDGKVIIAGSFNSVAGATSANVARFNSDSSPDFSFNSSTDGTVNAVAVLANGSTPVAPQDPNFAWITATGALRAGFAGDSIAQINGTVDSAVVQSDGSVIVAGNFRNNSGVTSNNILRLLPSGKLDSTYNPDPNNLISDMVLQPDGKLIIVGSFTSLQPSGQTNSTTRNYIARLNSNGSIDTAFDPNASAPISVVALQPDGKILIGGSFGSIDPNESTTLWVRENIARLNPDGTVDQNFNPNASGGVDAITLQPNGQILVGGAFNWFQPNATGNNIERNFLARLNADGSVDGAFDPEPNGLVSSIVVQSDGRVVFGGTFSAIQPDLGTTVVTRNNLARVNADGSIDNSYDPNANGSVSVLTPGPNGELYAGGSFLTFKPNGAILPTTRENLALIKADGTIDPSFDPAPNGAIDTIQVQPDGSLVVGGSFTQLQPTGAIFIGGSFAHVSSVPAANLALLNADGSPNTNFSSQPNGTVDALALQANGQVVIGGSFSSVGGTGRSNAARLNADNSLDGSFNPNVNGTVDTVALQPNGQILIGGSFSSVGGAGRSNLARLNADGSLDGSFAPAINGTVDAVVVQSNGQVLVGGSFSSAAGSARANLARLNADGSLDAGFNPGVNGTVNAVVLLANGQINVAGSFTQIGSTAALSIARLNADGSVDSGFSANTDGTVNALALEADGKLFLGGTFTHVDGLSRFRFARLGATTGATESLTVNGGFNAITWTRGGSAPELSQVAFQLSTDDVSWTTLGAASRSGSSWQLSNVALPSGTVFYLRTLGIAPSSGFASSSLIETVGSFDSATSFTGSAVSESASPATSGGSPADKAASFIVYGASKSGSGAGSDSPDASGQDSANARLIAFTSRADVTAADPIVSGFVLSGAAPKTVLIRAVGPGLSAFGVANPMPNPILSLYDGAGNLVVVNAGWGGSSALSALASEVGAFPLTIGSADAAVSATLAPGAYTLRVTGANGLGGAALAEVYDADSDLTAPQQIASVSSQAQVTAANSLVGGFVVANGPRTVLIRAIGPGLAGSGSLAAPVLNVFDSQGNLLASNAGWTAPNTVNPSYPAASASAISAAGSSAGASPLADGSSDAAIIATLPPGAYAVEVTTADGKSGQAKVEVYKF
ncbi:MAG TPA: delta-60 repeat domain-containing protein [Opitutaceae bacterium]|nr:delta-60 repeat domain-containing protein [Opitutaceae bacterium]